MLVFDETGNKEMIGVLINGHVCGFLMIFTDGYRFDPTGAQSVNAEFMRQIAAKLDELNVL